MDFDDLFAQLRKEDEEQNEKRKRTREQQLLEEKKELTELIRQAVANGTRKFHIYALSFEAQEALKKYCTIKTTFGMNPSTHDNDLPTGYEVTLLRVL